MSSEGLCKCGCGHKTARWDRGPKKGAPRDYLQGHGYPTKPDYKVNPETGCWVWLKNLRGGYGRVWRNGRLYSAHVWHWEQINGPVPDGMDLDHLCHNPKTCRGGMKCPHRACVNPEHLEPAARARNVQRGALTKLGQAEVDAIRATEPYWGYRHDLAREFSVTVTTISHVRSHKTWKL